jgi:hypothetical protein
MIGEHGISIWFFIGVALVVNGAIILATGLYEIWYPPANPVVLFQLHASVWWGAVLLGAGIFYAVRFKPRRQAGERL